MIFKGLQRITREVILEKLLATIDIPVIEHLLNETYENEKENIKENTESLGILKQIFDITKCDANDEWKKIALDCIENMNIEKEALGDYKSLSDIELYNMITKYYSINSQKLYFFSSIFKPLFQNILILIKHSYYYKALDIMNLGTLLLTVSKQAELKRLLKFLYLTSNNTSVPRLSDKKPNHIIVLNDFTECIFKSKLFSYEESRILLNFMFNNFDHLFLMSHELQETIEKRHSLILKNDQDTDHQIISIGKNSSIKPLLNFLKINHLDKQYCKRLTMKDYEAIGKEETVKCLVDLTNSLIDNVNISLKEKKNRLKQLKQTHPEIYQKHFSNIF